MDSQLPVLIVGAGPTGLAMACALTHLQIPFRIVDKNPEPVSGSNATWLQPRTLQFFNMLGIVDRFVKKGHHCQALTLRVKGKPLGRIPFDQTGSVYPYVLVLPQRETEKFLIAHLEERGGRVERPLSLTALSGTDSHVVVTLRSAGGAEECTSFSWVVACDGAMSTVRDICQIGFEGGELPGQFVVADTVMDSFLSPGEIHVFFDRETICAIFPMGSQRYRISANLHQSHPRKIFTEKEVREIVAERTDGNFNVESVSWISPFWAHSRQIDRMRIGRIFFAGDAAHIHSPAGGQGLNSGIQDVSNLAFKLALVMRGEASDTLLESYHAERYPVLQKTIAYAEYFTRVVQTRTSIRKKWEELIAPAPKTLPALIGKRIAALDTHYSDSPVIVIPGRPEEPSAPQPGDCAPEAILENGKSLYAELREFRHLVLLFEGKETNTVATTLQQDLQKKFSHRVRVMRVREKPEETGSSVIPDPDGRLHALYQVTGTGTYVIRPDGHIAACVSGLQEKVVEQTFEKYR